jgi:D-alanyl-lipoteichoic acid acyltransferase DltB (MBOAT superfamily)
VLFNSLDYLVFLTVALAGYWGLRHLRVARLVLVLVLSCLFYATSSPWYLGLIFFSTLVDWFVARSIAGSEEDAPRRRWLAVSVVVNLALLGFFKYGLAEDLIRALARGGVLDLDPDLVAIGLPVGISFYTFESLSYCIDVYRRHCPAARTPFELLFFITFFPKLVAGPIARPAELFPQIQGEPRLSRDQVSEGLFLILTGLVKKVIFADFVSINLVDRVFERPDGYTSAEVAVALYGFTLQMYADFSGYTDIARGSGKLFGIELPENFERPYQARSPAEFWRRWHMTLSTWLRDYLYFPLGGSRHGEARTYLNLWLTIFLIGLWHASRTTLLNFLLYGALQASAVALHRYVSRRWPSAGPDPGWLVAAKVLGTMQFVVFTRILFRARDLENAGEVWDQLVLGTGGMANVAPWLWAALLVGFAAHYTPLGWYAALRARFSALPAAGQGAVIALVLGLLLFVANGQTVPYIYFQF